MRAIPAFHLAPTDPDSHALELQRLYCFDVLPAFAVASLSEAATAGTIGL